MGQDEVYELIKRNGGLTGKEIALMLGKNTSTINQSCRKLEKWGEIKVMDELTETNHRRHRYIVNNNE